MKSARRSLLVPEVLQASANDCGPACLKAVLEGFGIAVEYDALRARCQTDVDGTSIDALAQLAGEHGLSGHEILVPRADVLLPEADCLPAIAVTRSGAGLLHFIVLWRLFGPFVMVMDPASGRRWVPRWRVTELLGEVPIHIPAPKWRRWAASRHSLDPLRARLRRLGVTRPGADSLIAHANADPSWRGFARLDACVRMLGQMTSSRVLRRGKASERALSGLLRVAADSEVDHAGDIPPCFRWIHGESRAGLLSSRSSVIVRFGGRDPRRDSSRGSPQIAPRGSAAGPPAPEPSFRALDSTRQRALRSLWHMAREQTAGGGWWLGAAVLLSGALALLEAVLLRGLLGVEQQLALGHQRLIALLALAVWTSAALGFQLCVNMSLARLGRRLETRCRTAFLSQLPRLEESYLRSRPSSDVAGRGQALHRIAELPELWFRRATAASHVAMTAACIAWLYPEGAWASAALGSCALLGAFAGWRVLAVASDRLRTHAAALDRFHLDAMLGAIPIRVHGAERSVASEHESLLVEWARGALSQRRAALAAQTLQTLCCTALASAIVLQYVAQHGAGGPLLLLVLWAFRIPLAGLELTQAESSLHALRPLALRVLALLGAPARAPTPPPAASLDADRAALGSRPTPGASLRLENVTLRAAGRTVLEGLDLTLPASSRVALVGGSGAGKSSLLGLLLGWNVPHGGRLLVDDQPTDGESLARLRRETAWIDPTVQLWDRSLYDNLTFGEEQRADDGLGPLLGLAELDDVLEALPRGLQADLGEGGLRLSGGQGQRVRVGRALLRGHARLVLLDEPFRGLERERRRALFERLCERFSESTLIYVSHDIRDTLDLERVLVLDQGRLVEDGKPHELAARHGSHYRRLLDGQQALEAELSAQGTWRRVTLVAGSLVEQPAP